mmetsp:Transcript_43825/g.133417  ORF Transcript_43825/g.133417 Transcript_43825/m.133417 type:complete len:166 (-) Transcript_43825:744-1241(-)
MHDAGQIPGFCGRTPGGTRLVITWAFPPHGCRGGKIPKGGNYRRGARCPTVLVTSTRTGDVPLIKEHSWLPSAPFFTAERGGKERPRTPCCFVAKEADPPQAEQGSQEKWLCPRHLFGPKEMLMNIVCLCTGFFFLCESSQADRSTLSSLSHCLLRCLFLVFMKL